MQRNKALPSLVLLATTSAILMGQGRTSPIVMGAGYEYAAPLSLAPGQLVTLFVADIPLGIGFARAPSSSDLPTSLAGVSVGMTDLTFPGLRALKAPILEVRPYRTCAAPTTPACFTPTAAVTVQVPLDVGINSLGAGTATLGVHVETNRDLPFSVDVFVLSDKVHILRVLDAVLPIAGPGMYGHCSSITRNDAAAPVNLTGLPCPPMVTHADGSLVSAKHPAKPGEELVAYAVGLGQTSPALETGRIVTSPARTVTTFTLDFNFRRNALPTRPPPVAAGGDGPVVPQPLYAGATPGFVGLYQINFVVPPVPPGTPPCAEIVGPQAPTANVVYSNLTVSVGGRYSFDGAGICVAADAAQTLAAPTGAESEGERNTR